MRFRWYRNQNATATKGDGELMPNIQTTLMPSILSGVQDITAVVGTNAPHIVGYIVAAAHEARASDIHFDPKEHELLVRMRIDGVLRDMYTVPLVHGYAVIARIKVLAGLRLDEHTVPQDGRFRMQLSSGDHVDVRVSVSPTYHGENAVLRLLANVRDDDSLESLGFSHTHRASIERRIAEPTGLILTTGPTGSGKTTTLYGLLRLLNTRDRSIITLEDPIEYEIDGVRQIQINPAQGFTFGNGLRSVVRQDPDIVMVGEIRDTETARLAVNTALTGHLVLSSLHTNDAPSALVRMIDMGVEPYLLASTVSLVIGQRLVRTICQGCIERKELSADDGEFAASLGVYVGHFKHGRGCGECMGMGYRGRVGVYELMEMTDSVRELVMNRARSKDIAACAAHDGYHVLLYDALQKAYDHITTFAEVRRLSYVQ